MKIAILADGRDLRGNERQVLLIAQGLRDRGHDVVVAGRKSGPAPEAFAAAGMPMALARPRGAAAVWSLLRFVGWLRRERPDVLVLATWKRLPSAAVAARLARVPRVVLRIGLRQQIPAGGRSGRKYRRALDRLDAVVANGSDLAEYLAEVVPGLASRIRVVRNAVQPALPPPGELRKEIGAREDDVVFVAAGGLERRKGFDLLVRALARTGRSRIRIAIAGAGPMGASLQALADALGIADHVHLLGHRDDLPALLAASDGFVLPSRSDSLANAMLEAMAAGLPVIATSVDGTAEALAPVKGRRPAGWVVPPGDEDGLARALLEVAAGVRAGSPDVRARAAEARWRIDHWFTVQRMVDEYEAVLHGLVQARRA